MADGYVLSPEFIEQIRRGLRKLDGMSGGGVTNLPGGITLGPPGGPPGTLAPAADSPPEVRRFKVMTAGNADDVAVCKPFDGTTAGDTQFPVWVLTDPDAGDEIYAVRACPNTEKTFVISGTTYPVIWREIGGGSLPPGTGKFKVMQLIDDLSPGTPDWDYVRFTTGA